MESKQDNFQNFKQLLDSSGFWENYFEKNIHSFKKTGFDLNFTLETFEELLWSHESSLQEKVTVNKDGNTIFYQRDVAGKDHFRWLMDQFQKGGTIIFNGIDEIYPDAAKLARSIDSLFNGHTTINAFLTPPGAKGFLPHFDTHDVFILQTAGKKKWKLFPEQIKLPLDRQIYFVNQKELGDPLKEFLLEKRDLLYIPRGVIHGAEADQSYSLHLTIGVRPLLKVDYLKLMLDVIAENDPDFREHFDMTDKSEATKLMQKVIREYTNHPYFVNRTNEEVALKLLSKSRPLPHHHIKNILQKVDLSLESKVEKAYHGKAIIQSQLNRIKFYYPGVGLTGDDDHIQQGCLNYDAVMYGALNFINSSENEFQVKDLPEIYPDEVKISVVNDLLTEGFLTFA